MRLILGFICMIFLMNCASTKNYSKNIVAISFIVNFPVVQGDNQLFYFRDTIPIFYYQDLILYKLPYTFDSSKMIYHTKTDTIEQQNILTETRYNYFVYRHGKQYGIWYKEMNSDSLIKLSVDSIIDKKGTPTILQSILANPNDTLVARIRESIGNIFIEKYASKSKPDESYNDTTLLYYSKNMKYIKFSFSPILDSIKKLKLFKVKLIYNKAYSSKYSITMPQRELTYEFQKKQIENNQQVIAFFQRFKRDEKILK